MSTFLRDFKRGFTSTMVIEAVWRCGPRQLLRKFIGWEHY